MTIRCVCGAVIELKTLDPSSKVRCPKCSTILKIKVDVEPSESISGLAAEPDPPSQNRSGAGRRRLAAALLIIGGLGIAGYFIWLNDKPGSEPTATSPRPTTSPAAKPSEEAPPTAAMPSEEAPLTAAMPSEVAPLEPEPAAIAEDGERAPDVTMVTPSAPDPEEEPSALLKAVEAKIVEAEALRDQNPEQALRHFNAAAEMLGQILTEHPDSAVAGGLRDSSMSARSLSMEQLETVVIPELEEQVRRARSPLLSAFALVGRMTLSQDRIKASVRLGRRLGERGFLDEARALFTRCAADIRSSSYPIVDLPSVILPFVRGATATGFTKVALEITDSVTNPNSKDFARKNMIEILVKRGDGMPAAELLTRMKIQEHRLEAAIHVARYNAEHGKEAEVREILRGLLGLVHELDEEFALGMLQDDLVDALVRSGDISFAKWYVDRLANPLVQGFAREALIDAYLSKGLFSEALQEALTYRTAFRPLLATAGILKEMVGSGLSARVMELTHSLMVPEVHDASIVPALGRTLAKDEDAAGALFEAALRVADGLQDNRRWRLYAGVSYRMARLGRFDEAINTTKRIKGDYYRRAVIRLIVSFLECSNMHKEAIDLAESIKDVNDRVFALCEIALPLGILYAEKAAAVLKRAENYVAAQQEWVDERAPAVARIAMTYHRIGKTDRARRLLSNALKEMKNKRKCLASKPTFPYGDIAGAYVETGMMEKGLKIIAGIPDRYVRKITWVEIAEALISVGRFEDAKTPIRKAVETYRAPENKRFGVHFRLLVQAMLHAGMTKQAEELVIAAGKPLDKVRAYLTMAVHHHRNGDASAASVATNEAVKVAKAASGWMGGASETPFAGDLAQALVQMGQEKEALTTFTDLLGVRWGEEEIAMFARGFAAKDSIARASELADSLPTKTSNPDSANHRAHAHLAIVEANARSGRYDDALLGVSQLEDSGLEGWALAEIAYMLGRQASTVDSHGHFLGEELAGIAKELHGHGKTEEATILLDAALETTTRVDAMFQLDALVAIAEGYSRMGIHDKACLVVRSAVDLYSDHADDLYADNEPPLLSTAACVFGRAGREAEAAKLGDQALLKVSRLEREDDRIDALIEIDSSCEEFGRYLGRDGKMLLRLWALNVN